MAHETLTKAEIERLELLIEECSEVIQSATKTLRHGYESFHPFIEDSDTNRVDLSEEIIDVMSVIKEMSARNDLSAIFPKDMAHPNLDVRWNRKLKYMHHH